MIGDKYRIVMGKHLDNDEKNIPNIAHVRSVILSLVSSAPLFPAAPKDPWKDLVYARGVPKNWVTPKWSLNLGK